MANENNLKKGKATQFRTGEEQAKIAKKGGKASGKKRREQKTVRDILSTVLDGKIKDNEQFAKLAAKMGVNDKKSVKDIYTLVCLLNSVEKGDLSDLERLTRLLGEDKQNENTDVISKLDSVIGEVDKLAE